MNDLLIYAVPQRDIDLGCIPTGYEILLRAAQVTGVDFDTFQEDFNLQARGLAENNFESVKDAIMQQYPHLKLQVKAFPTGGEKAAFLERRFQQGEAVLASIYLGPEIRNGQLVHICHIMPLLRIVGDEFVFLGVMRSSGQKVLLP